MQNENYLGVECPKCGRMFKAGKLQVVFFCNSNYIGKCPRCGCEVEAHLTKRAVDLGWTCANCGCSNIESDLLCGFCDTPRPSH